MRSKDSEVSRGSWCSACDNRAKSSKTSELQTMPSIRVSRTSLNVVFDWQDRKKISEALRTQRVALEVWAMGRVLGIVALRRQAGDAAIWNISEKNCLWTFLFTKQCCGRSENRIARCALVRVGQHFSHLARTAAFRRLDPGVKRQIVAAAARRLSVFNCVDVFQHATAYEESSAASQARRFIADKYASVASTPGFISLSKWCLLSVLKCERVSADRETIRKSIVVWAQRGVPGYECDIDDLLEHMPRLNGSRHGRRGTKQNP